MEIRDEITIKSYCILKLLLTWQKSDATIKFIQVYSNCWLFKCEHHVTSLICNLPFFGNMLLSLLTIISRIFWRFSNKRWCNSIDVDLIFWNSESKGLTVEGFFKWKAIWNNVKRFQSILFSITLRKISSALRKILKNSRLTVTVRAGSRLPKFSKIAITAEISKIAQK